MVVKTALSSTLRSKLLLGMIGASLVASLLPQEAASIADEPTIEVPQAPAPPPKEPCT